jgi:putative ABC transport system permease protein
MSVAVAATPNNGRWLPLRFALRELRGGLQGFYVFIACIALGAMAIAGVGSLAASLADGMTREGQVILGGDLSFTLIQREAAPQEQAFLESHGKLSSAATMRAMARTGDGQATLVEMKAVPTRSRNATAHSAPPPTRRCWRDSASSRARS